MLNLFVFLVAPAAGGALLCKLWLTRGPRRIHTSLAVGCYCEDEAHCHRSVLRELLVARGAEVV